MNDGADEESGLLLPSEGLATPSTKPPVSGKSARDTLSRIKSKRAESSSNRNKSMDASASASSINSSTPVDQSIDRRRVLQRIKNNEKNRASADSLDLTTEAAAAAARDSSNQGPRSPLKSLVRKSAALQSMRSSRKSLVSEAEGGEEEEEDGEEGRSDEGEEEQEEEEYRPILCSHDPEPAFPLSFFPGGGMQMMMSQMMHGGGDGLENELQHVVWTPAGAALSAVVCCSGPSLCHGTTAGGAETGETKTLLKERDFIEMDWNHELAHWVASQTVDSQELRAFHDQLMDREAATSSPSAASSSSASSACDRRDGIYRPAVPPLAMLLLEGAQELPPRDIAQFSAPHLALSRVTQRLLRDVKGGIEAGSTRRLWQSMAPSPSSRKEGDPSSTSPVPDDPSHHHQQQQPPSSVRPAVPGEVHLLKCLSKAPMLRVIEDPTIGTSAQPLFPATAVSYGGQIGHWAADASSSDRVGALPKGWSARRGGGAGGGGQRATFRLHLHQLLLTDHPLMSAEERRLADLRIVYAQYRQLFEQKTLEHLTQRLLVLISELASSVSSLSDDQREETAQSADDQLYQAAQVSVLRGIYRDLIETIPALNELNSAMDSLSASVYAGWRDIELIRRSNSDICHTGAVLSVRKVNSNLAAPAPSAGGDDDDDDVGGGGGGGGGGQFWEAFRTSLLDIPRLVAAAQTIIFRADNSKIAKGREDEATAAAMLNPQDSPRGSEFSAPQLALKASDEQLDRQVALARTVSAIRESVQTLVDSNGLIPQYALRLTEDGAITPDHQLPALEAKRRVLLRGTRLKAVLKVDGSTVTATEYRPLSMKMGQPSMSCCCEFNQFFEFRVFFQPRDVSFDLYSRSRSDSWAAADVFLATVSIPLPGQCFLRPRLGGPTTAASHHKVVAHSYSPSSGWYSFSTDAPSVPRRAMRDMGCTDEELARPQRIEGSMLCTAEYDMGTVEARSPYEPIQPGEVTLLPTLTHKQSLLALGSGGLSGSRSDAAMIKAYDFTRENDFQLLLPDLEDIDENDPLNDRLLYSKAKRGYATSSSSNQRQVFRLVGGDYASSFSSEGGSSFANYVRFKEPARMKLLQLRSLKPHLFQQPIPLNEALIKSDAFYKNLFLKEIHEKMMARLGNSSETTTTTAVDEYDLTEATAAAATAPGTDKRSINAPKIASFLQRVRSSQTASSRQRKKPHFVTSSVVVETDYLQFEEAEVVDCFGRLRRLHPKPKYREAASIQVDKCELLVQIVGAKNIPLRSEEQSIQSQLLTASRATAGGAGGGGGGVDEQPLVSEHLLDERKRKDKLRARTFVEVRFQEHSATTSTLDGGSCPMWRQSVALPFHAPQDDFSPDSLQQVRDVVYFTLFDEVLEDDTERGGFLEGESPLRVEKRYIGSFSMPFETIYREGRIEGVFRVDTPTINFGYDHAASTVTARGDNGSGMFVGSSNDSSPSTPAAAPNDPDMLHMAQTGLLGALDCFLQCLVSSNVKKPQEYDSLYSSSTFIHRSTQSEFAYYAMDDSVTYLKVMITLDPILVTAPSVPDEVTLSSVRREDRDISLFARKWLLGVKATNHVTARRQYKLFGADSKGSNVFVGRYLTPQRPPAGFESRRSCVHLVSSIPFMKDGQSFVGSFDLWCNSKEFWEIGAGDEEEHAVQLFNYLYFLSLPSRKRTALEDSSSSSSSSSSGDVLRESVFLVLGKAVPEGDSVYVMLRDDARSETDDHPWRADNFLLINPCTGFMYSAMDPNGPIRDIQVLFTPSNAWANLQVAERPAQLSFNLLDPSCWRPFFGHRLSLPPGGLTPIQPAVEYVETSPGYALEVEKSLTQTLRNTVRRWRSRRHRSTTAFHQGACDAISDLLPRLEQWKRSGGGGGTADTTTSSSSSSSRVIEQVDNYGALIELQRLTQDRLRQMLKTRTLRGFPINMPFTDEDEIVAKIKASCVHELKHPDVQFVLSVRAFPLYNNIISLWVFLGTLEPVRS